MERGPLSDPKVKELVEKRFRAAQVVAEDLDKGTGKDFKRTMRVLELAVLDPDGKLVYTVSVRKAKDPAGLLAELKTGLEKAGLDPDKTPKKPKRDGKSGK